MTSGPWALLRGFVVFVYVFSLGPILITAAVSFNATNRSFFPPRGFSFRWWEKALAPEWIDPLLFSLKLGTLTAIFSTLLALPLAFAFYRYRFRGRDALIAMTLGPLMPTLVTGVGLLQLFQYLGWREYMGFTALLVGRRDLHAVLRCTRYRSACTLPPTSSSPRRASAQRWATLRHVVFAHQDGARRGRGVRVLHSFTDINLSIFGAARQGRCRQIPGFPRLVSRRHWPPCRWSRCSSIGTRRRRRAREPLGISSRAQSCLNRRCSSSGIEHYTAVAIWRSTSKSPKASS
jgi:hypothetical protein